MNELDLNTRVAIVETNTKNVCKKLDDLKITTGDIYNKLDGIEKNIFNEFNSQKNLCMAKKDTCSNEFVSNKTFQWMWKIGAILFSIIVGIVSFDANRIYSFMDTVDSRIHVIENERMPIEIRDFYNPKTGTRTHIKYYEEEPYDKLEIEDNDDTNK